MGLLSPVHTARGMTTSRPPVVMVVICLLFFTTATVVMAMFIKHSDNILNPEIKGNWHKFLSVLADMELCAGISSNPTSAEIGDVAQLLNGNMTAEEQVSVSVQASMLTLRELIKLPPGKVAVSGTLRMGSWPRLCYEGDPGDNPLTISFYLPHNVTSDGDHQVCVILTGSSKFLPLSLQASTCVPATFDRTKTLVGTVRASGGETCSNGTALKLQYDVDPEHERYYLTSEQRWTVYSRLMHASYILLGVATALIVYLVIPVKNLAPPTSDKIPLTI